MFVPVLILATSLSAPPTLTAPAGPPATADQANTFAERMTSLIPLIRDKHPKSPSRSVLVKAGIAGLYDAIRRPVPEEFQILDDDTLDIRRTFYKARWKAGQAPELAGIRDYIHGTNGFAQVLDPSCTLTLARSGPFSMSDQELLGGIELEGINPIEWMNYRIELGSNSQAVLPPVPIPWTVKRVTAGLAAAAADLRPGDEILAIDGERIQADSAPRLLPMLLLPLLGQKEGSIGSAAGKRLTFTIRRDRMERPLVLEIPKRSVEELPRESVFGYERTDGGTWNYFLPGSDKIAYIRLSGFDDQTPNSLIDALNEIAKSQPVGLLLDLRWSPGGSLQSGGRVASAFFQDHQEIARVTWKDPTRNGERLPRLPAGVIDELWQTIPLAVLINSETYGGGETIAGAVKAHKRGLVMGQRTSGRGLFYLSVNTDVPGLFFRITSGKIDYPFGRNRHRHENLGPLDEWGVRPDPGFEIPSTLDFSKKLKESYERQTIRPAGQSHALDIDDPLTDPQRALAIKLFRESLAKTRRR